MDAEELRESDPELFFAAVYYLPGGSMMFENPSYWFGQQPADFNDQLNEEEQEQIIETLDRTLSNMDRQSKENYITRFERWTEAYRDLEELSDEKSTEEFLAAAYETQHFEQLFQPLIEDRNIEEDRFSSTELIGMFASSENIMLHYRMAQELSMLSPSEAKKQIGDIKKAMG